MYSCVRLQPVFPGGNAAYGISSSVYVFCVSLTRLCSTSNQEGGCNIKRGQIYLSQNQTLHDSYWKLFDSINFV